MISLITSLHRAYADRRFGLRSGLTGVAATIRNRFKSSRRNSRYRNYEHLKERLLTVHHTKYTRQG